METYGDDVDNPRATEAQREVNQLMERLGETTRELDRRTRAFVREHPTAAVLGAVAIGFLLGRLVVRR